VFFQPLGNRGLSLQLGADTAAASNDVRVLGAYDFMRSEIWVSRSTSTNISAACFYRLR